MIIQKSNVCKCGIGYIMYIIFGLEFLKIVRSSMEFMDFVIRIMNVKIMIKFYYFIF